MENGWFGWFPSDGFMPHGHCYLWRSDLVSLHVGSDALIALAYFSIPLWLIQFVRRRRDLPFPWVFVAFGTFIVSCGLTHLMEIWTLWEPHYWLSGGVKAFTAVASLITAATLIPLMPKALALRSAAELEEANRELRIIEGRFRAAIEGTNDAFLILEAVRDARGQIVDFSCLDHNRVAGELLGCPRERLVGARLSTVFPTELYGAFFEGCAEAIDKQRRRTLETKVPPLSADVPLKKLGWLQHEIIPQGQAVAVTTRDLTGWRIAEEQLLHNMSEGVALLRMADDQVIFANETFESILGYPRGALAGHPGAELGLSSAALSERPRTNEQEEQTTSGARRWVRTTSSLLVHPQHGAVWLVSKLDVTQRKHDELITARLAAIVESTNDSICSLRPDGVIETWNEGAARLYGYSAEEMIGRPADRLVPEAQRAEAQDHLARAIQGERVQAVETVRFRRDGRAVDVSLTTSPIQTKGGAIVGVSQIARDISERKTQERLLQSSLREKTVLLTEIHHRVKNNLQVISSLLKLHAERVEAPSARATFESAQARVRSIALVHELLYQSQDLGAVQVRDYAQSLLRAIGQFRPEVPVHFAIETEETTLEAEQAVPFGLILNELVTNALKHAFDPIPSPGAAVQVEVRSAAGALMLQVSDNGRGFPEALASDQGPNLGLHLVRSLTRQLGGSIELDNSAGGRARLSFPQTTRRHA